MQHAENPWTAAETDRFPTPFGDVRLMHGGAPLRFRHSTMQHVFRSGVCGTVHRLELDTLPFALHDTFDLQVGAIDDFAYYDSDEYTVMLAHHDSAHLLALIARDTGYSAQHDAFLTRPFSFSTECEKTGIRFRIERVPQAFPDESDRTLTAWVIWLPVSESYDAAELIDIDFV